MIVSCDRRSVLMSLPFLHRCCCSSSSLSLRVHLQDVSNSATYHHTSSHDHHCLQIGHSWIHSQHQASCCIYIYSAVNTTTTTIATSITTTEDAHQQIQWVGGRGHHHHHHHHSCRSHLCACMHVYMYVSLKGGGWQAVCMQMHSIVCEPWQRDACMYECHTEWYRAMHGWWMDGWLWWMAMVIRGSFVLVNEWWRGDVELNECMQAWMDWQLFVCVFVYVYVVGWFAWLVCRVEQSTLHIVKQEPLRIAISLQMKHNM